MTSLAVSAALLGLSVDTRSLWLDDDPDYELWLGCVVDRIDAAHREAEKKGK